MILILTVAPPYGAKLGPGSRQTFRADGGMIGRSAACDWVLPHPRVSGRHALISYRDGTFFIEDRSKNGVRINSLENRLVVGQPRPLNSGDRLLIDPYEIDVLIANESQDDVRGPAVTPAPSISNRANPFEIDDPFDDKPFPAPSTTPPFPSSHEPPYEGEIGQELDPLELLGGEARRQPARKARGATDLERNSPLDGHYRPPAAHTPAPAPPPPSLLIPENYDPLAPDDPSSMSKMPAWKPPVVEAPVPAAPPEPVLIPVPLSPSSPRSAVLPPMAFEEPLFAPLKPIAPPAPDLYAPLFRVAEADAVRCTVFAPPMALRGQGVMVQVFAHRTEDAGAVAALARDCDERAKQRGSKELDRAVERDSALTFVLSMPGVEIGNSTQQLIWRGRPEAVQFSVSIPANHAPGDAVGTVYVIHNSVPFGQVTFVLSIRDTDERPSATPMRRSDDAGWRRYEYAFISYASADRREVCKRVQMLARCRIRFFHDLLSLEPGERWERTLYKTIDECDVFFLFWSAAAKASEWVLKETLYALEIKMGNEFARPAIIPIILEGPPPVPPPDELKDLHFNDPFMYLIGATP